MKKTKMKKVNVLGTIYSVMFETLAENITFKECVGYSDFYEKEIHIRRCTHDDEDYDEVSSMKDSSFILLQHKCLKHELTHAFLFESGLAQNSKSSANWAMNEEMVDWIAIQMPKILSAFNNIVESEDK